MMPLRQKDGRIEVRVGSGGQWIDIHQLRQHSLKLNEGRIYKYFLSLVELSADLNIGRNHNAYQ